MAEMFSCPDPDVLRRLTVGLIPNPEAAPLEQHLSTCGRCVETLHGLKAGDTLSDALRGGEAVLARLGDEHVRGLVERLEAMAPTADGAIADADGKELAALASRLTAYRVVTRLGAGGMGVVYQVENLALGRMEALKVMRPALAENDGARRRFLREARAMATVKHEHVATVYHVIDDPDAPFLTMELLEGETLEDRLQREKRLGAAEVLRIGREIAEGLAAAHDRRLIHRDVKPGNIWLEGDRAGVKILDFGLARAADAGGRLTQSGAIVGTPAYMAPEQADGKAVDARCDLFSLGCVLYRMATGEPPFRGEGMFAVLKAVAEHLPPPPRSRNPDLPPELSALVMRLLEKDPARRPASAREVAEAFKDLERRMAAVSTLTAARPDGGAKKPGRRWVWFAAAAAAVLLALIPVGVLCGPTVVRIVTNKGVLVIETGDEKVQVNVKGQVATIIAPGTKREIEVTAGDQEIEVRELPDGLHFFTKTFTLCRGGTEIVHVRQEMAKAAAAGAPPPAVVVNSIGMKLLPIEPGKFTMGSPDDEEGHANLEGPRHPVEITRQFCMGVYPVTRGQFAAFVKDAGYQTDPERAGDNYNWRTPPFPSPYDQTNDDPVVAVTRGDALRFCEWLSKKEDKTYGLPTEAEWEYACRAGTKTAYFFGDDPADLGDHAWYDGNAARHTRPVGLKKPNPWGLYDMHGNVWQWCMDGSLFGEYQRGYIKDPLYGGEKHMARGGSWFRELAACRSATRLMCSPDFRAFDIGFRVVMRPGAAPPPPMPPPAEPSDGAGVAPFDAAHAKALQEACADRLGVPVELANSVGMKLRLIPPGKYKGPRHVGVENPQPFYMGACPVTVGQFRRFVEETKYRTTGEVNGLGGNCPSLPGTLEPQERNPKNIWSRQEFAPTDDHPVALVTWQDAMDFCDWLGRKEGRTYRLPTMQWEWSWAALAGSPDAYYFGNEGDGLDDYVWHKGNSGYRSHPVGEKKANPWGLFDMHGNVWQLTYLWERKGQLVDMDAAQNGPTDADRTFCMGGSWHDVPAAAWIYTYNNTPSITYCSIGFRVVLVGDLKAAAGKGP